jgi:cell division protein FtsX
LSWCAMSSPSAVAATITKLQGSKQVEYDRAQPRPRPKRRVSIPSLIAVVVAAVLVGLMLVLIMPVD